MIRGWKSVPTHHRNLKPREAKELHEFGHALGCIHESPFSTPNHPKSIMLYPIPAPPVHPSTLPTVNNMALVFGNQGEYEKALEWYQRALDGREKTPGKDHPSTLDPVHNMAFVFDHKGEHEKALE